MNRDSDRGAHPTNVECLRRFKLAIQRNGKTETQGPEQDEFARNLTRDGERRACAMQKIIVARGFSPAKLIVSCSASRCLATVGREAAATPLAELGTGDDEDRECLERLYATYGHGALNLYLAEDVHGCLRRYARKAIASVARLAREKNLTDEAAVRICGYGVLVNVIAHEVIRVGTPRRIDFEEDVAVVVGQEMSRVAGHVLGPAGTILIDRGRLADIVELPT